MVLNDTTSESAARTAAEFATTHWSVVLAAGDSASPGLPQALEKLCQTYWYPLYAFIRRKGNPPEEAKDLTQAFFERAWAETVIQTCVERLRAEYQAEGKASRFDELKQCSAQGLLSNPPFPYVQIEGRFHARQSV